MNDIRRGVSDQTLMMRAGVVLVCLAAALALVVTTARGAFDNHWDVTAHAGLVIDGVPRGADVRFRGLIVGSVRDAQIAPNGSATLRLAIDRDKAKGISGPLVARIVPSNIFALSTVELVESRTGGSVLRPGAEIPADHSQGAIEAQTVIARAYQFLTAVEPAKLAQALDALTAVLDGRSDQIGDLFVDASDFTGKVANEAPQIEAALAEAAKAARAVSKVTPETMKTVKAALKPIRIVADHQNRLRDLLASGTRATGVAHDLVTQDGAASIRVIRQAGPVAKSVAVSHGAIAKSFHDLGMLAKFRYSVPNGPDGPLVRVDFRFQAGRYNPNTPEDCPVYPSAAGVPALHGPQCGGNARSGEAAGGTVGSVGSASEHDLINQLFEKLSTDHRTPDGDAAQLMGGPILRGMAVETP